MEKNNFILYKDQRAMVDKLSDERAGKVFKAIYNYVCGDGDPTDLDEVSDMVFTAFKTTLHRDLMKYRDKCAKNTEAVNKRWDKVKDTNEYVRIEKDTHVSKKPDITDEIEKRYSDKKAKAVLEYLDMRKKIKKPLANLDYLDRELKRLSEDEDTQIAILEQSTFNSWQGVYQLTNKNVRTGEKKDIQVTYDSSINTPATDEELEAIRKFRKGE